MKNTKKVKYCYFSLIHNWPDWCKIKYCNIKAFYKTHSVYSYNQWNYFQRGCISISGGQVNFQYKLVHISFRVIKHSIHLHYFMCCGGCSSSSDCLFVDYLYDSMTWHFKWNTANIVFAYLCKCDTEQACADTKCFKAHVLHNVTPIMS